MGPSTSRTTSKTPTVNTRAWRVRRVESASWCGSWPWAVRMMKLSTPASSQDPSRSFIQRCSVLRRTEALPGKGRLVAVLTPYSIVGARRISSAPERSSARRSTMMVSQPSGRWGPCCSHVPTGTRRRASRSRMKRTSSGTRVLRCSGALTSRSPAAPRPLPPRSGCTGARRAGRGRRAQRASPARCSSSGTCAGLSRSGLRPRRRWRSPASASAPRWCSACCRYSGSSAAGPTSVRSAMSSRSLTPGVERGVVILAPDGEPVAWAGRHRFVPARDTAELRAVITPFYVSLEARRQTQGGGSAVGTVLLDAVPAAPDRSRAVSARLEDAYGVALRFYTPGLAPDDPDVFDYCPISCEHGDTLFSVQPVAPAQGDAKLAALRGVTERAAIALVAVLLLACLAAPRGRWRWLVVLVAAWCVARAPIGYSLHMAEQFSPALFYRSMLGVFSASAGALTVLGVVALCAASVLWRRGLARRWWNVVGAAVLVLAAPYLVRYLGRGIAPPAGGVGFVLWMSWEAGVATAAMALVLA